MKLKIIPDIYMLNINNYMDSNLQSVLKWNKKYTKYNYIIIDESYYIEKLNCTIKEYMSNNKICKYFISINRLDFLCDYLRIVLINNTSIKLFVDLDTYIIDLNNIVKSNYFISTDKYNRLSFNILYNNGDNNYIFKQIQDIIENNYKEYKGDKYLKIDLKIPKINLKYVSILYNPIKLNNATIVELDNYQLIDRLTIDNDNERNLVRIFLNFKPDIQQLLELSWFYEAGVFINDFV